MSRKFEISLFSVKGENESPLKDIFSLVNCSVHHSLNKLPRAMITLLEMKANASEFMIATANDLKVGCAVAIKVTYIGETPVTLMTGVVEKQTLQSDYTGTRVYLELLHPEHEAIMLDGSGCIVQTYSTNIHGLTGHIIAATGAVKAAALRLKVWGGLISGVGLAGGAAQ